MTKNEYETKLNQLLSDTDTYEKMTADPTTRVTNELNKLLTKLNISARLTSQIVIKNTTSPRIYGLPKIHKIGNPLRPIVSTINSPCYNLAKYLCKILKNFTNDSRFNIKNSFDLKNILNDITLDSDDVLVSFDVVSLFTNIPTKIAIREVDRRWEEIKFMTDLDKTTFIKLLNFVIDNNNYFKYNNNIYKQKFGLAMGNPLSPILADLVLERLFEKCLPKLERQPTMIKKYVDDIIIAIPENYIETTLETFHSFNSHIKFTIEKENNNSITFLDMRLFRVNSKIKTCWYKKDTSSDRVLNFLSSHPQHMKINLATSFARRVLTLSEPEFYNSNIDTITRILQRNNYPDKIIKKSINKAISNNNSKPNSNQTIQTANTQKFACLTYVPHLTEKITKIIKQNNNNNSNEYTLGFKIPNKLQTSFSNLKDKIPLDKQHDVVYEIPCQCGKKYIGQTKQKLRARVQKHQSDIRCNNKQTALSTHAIENSHNFE